MYIAREIDHVLKEWAKETNRKPLLLRGVRQCGKTSAVRHLSEQFDSYVEINLERLISLHDVFSGDLNISKILQRIELESGVRIVPGQTLLFIDEIQACPRAIVSLRYFYEQIPELHVVAAGSLLEFVLSGKKGQRISFPVGRIRSMYLYPLSFREFLKGTGQRLLCDYLDDSDLSEMDPSVHEKLIEQYKVFLLVGGMPEAVSVYMQTNSLLEVQQIHRDILANFRDDFAKYSETISSDIIEKVFDFSLHNVCSQIKATSAIKGISAYIFEETVTLLSRAGLVYPVLASSCDTLPIGSGEKLTNMKLIFFDTGIYLTELKLAMGDLLSAKLFDEINKGDVAEMQTGLELIKYSSPYEASHLYYWYRSGANAEIDYVIQIRENIVPVEVKASGKGSMQSMYSFLERQPLSNYGIRICLENFSEYNNVKVYPLYAVGRIMSE